MENQYLDLKCERRIPLYDRLGKSISLNGKTVSYQGKVRLLSEKDLDKIMNLELKTNIPDIRVTESKIRYRFGKGNQMLGFELEDGDLIASVGWRFAKFHPERPDSLPSTFEEYSTSSSIPPVDFNAMYHYGINVDPKTRKEGIGGEVFKNIFESMFSQGKLSGCNYCVFDPRLHTYNGSNDYPEIERFPYDPRMKRIVDKAISGKGKFILQDALRDPAFRVYTRLAGQVKLIKLMPRIWFPSDKPSGGYGFYCYKEL